MHTIHYTGRVPHNYNTLYREGATRQCMFTGRPESRLFRWISPQKDDQLYSIIIINTTILIILMAMFTMDSITAQMVCSITLLLLLSPLALAGECFRALRKVVPHNPPIIKSSISPQGSFCPESLAASHHRWRSVLASTPITLTIQVLRAFQCSAIFTILQECLASLSLASADERHGVATVARPRPRPLLPRPRHQCRRLQELSS